MVDKGVDTRHVLLLYSTVRFFLTLMQYSDFMVITCVILTVPHATNPIAFTSHTIEFMLSYRCMISPTVSSYLNF